MESEVLLTGGDNIAGQNWGGLAMFAALVTKISSSTKTNDKLDALVNYFAVAPQKDKVWVIALFSGRRPKRVVNSTLLWTWCNDIAGIPGWLFAECYHTVGDLAETISLLLPEPSNRKEEGGKSYSLSFYLEKFIEIEKHDESVRKEFILNSWNRMNQN